MTMLALLALATASAQKSKTPLVYDVENTGSKFVAPTMPAADQLTGRSVAVTSVT